MTLNAPRTNYQHALFFASNKFLSDICPYFLIFRGNGKSNIGVVMNEGPKWEVNRKLMIRELKGTLLIESKLQKSISRVF